MDHDRADDFVLDLAEGALASGVEDEVRIHAEQCAECREAIERLAAARRISARVARELARTETHDAPPHTVDAQVLSAAARMAAGRRASRRRARRRSAVVIFAVAACAAGVASLIAAAS